MIFPAVSFWVIFTKTADLPATLGDTKGNIENWKKMKKVVDKQKEGWYYKSRC